MSTIAGDRSTDAATDEESPLSGVVGTANTLLLVPSMEPADDHACAELSIVASPEETAAVWVTYAQSLTDRLAVWNTHVNDDPPVQTGFIDAGSSQQSPESPPRGSLAVNGLSVESVSPPDLTGLGIAINEYASQWNDDSLQLTLCFHSLSMLLQYVSLQHAFRFLHSTTALLRSADAAAHFHMDPTVHDDQTLNTTKMLFDAVAERVDNEWTVTSR